jgi:hypothetical protein
MKDKLVPPAPAATVENTAHALRSCRQAALLGEHSSREQAEDWAIKYFCVCAAMTLTDEQRAKAVAVIRELPTGQDTIEAFASACEREPSLADFGSAIKARAGEPSWFLSSLTDSEIDLKCVVDSSFESGNGVLTFGASTPDEVIIFAIRSALAVGKPFKVVPA